MKDNNCDQQGTSQGLLKRVFRVYGRKQEPGEPPLDTLPPWQRIVPDAPLTPEERNALVAAGMKWLGIEEAPPDHPIYQQGWTLRLGLPRWRPKGNTDHER